MNFSLSAPQGSVDSLISLCGNLVSTHALDLQLLLLLDESDEDRVPFPLVAPSRCLAEQRQ
jgi:hypothetical protein